MLRKTWSVLILSLFVKTYVVSTEKTYIYIYTHTHTKPAEDCPGGLVVKNPQSKARDVSLICSLGRFHIPQGN